MHQGIHALLIIVTLGSSSVVHGAVTMPSVFDDNMVLQRELPVAVFGQADPGEAVTVSFAGASKSTKAGDDGAWLVHLDPMSASAEGRTLTVTGTNTLTFKDVVVGEVWVGSGQSNMRWSVARTQAGKEAMSGGSNPDIRLYMIPYPKETKQKGFKKADFWSWEISDQATISKFSAVQYYFGVKLQKELGVPVGLICAARGSSSIGGWQVGGRFYDFMIKPMQPFTVRGVIWYQGESDVQRGTVDTYEAEFQRLITDWRDAWQSPEMPFYFVQIAPWSGSKYPADDLPKLWEAQVAALKLPNTGMAVVSDTVSTDTLSNIHPYTKVPAGERLALWALAKDHGKDVVYSGPLFKSAAVEGTSIRVSFAHAKGLRASDGKDLTEFRIAGADEKFVTAQAVIDGDTLDVSSPDVAAPKYVQFGWHNTALPNLVNAAGLPASPFQSKDWKGGTGE